MLIHNSQNPAAPKRVVVLGSTGFLAKALIGRLTEAGVAVRAIGRQEIDLSEQGAGERLAGQLEAGDTLVFLSAVTPDKGRGIEHFLANVRMGEAVCTAIAATMPAHIIYVSSDAVYPFTAGETSETSCAEPTDLYGAAHLSRELMLKGAAKCPVAILRPTMIYGGGDTHNSYGANRFRRAARKDGKIAIFGGGEETRDHISIDDAAMLIELVIRHRSAGTLNLVSGRSISFGDLARMVAGHFSPAVAVEQLPRQGTVVLTHRKFDASAVSKAFPAFKPTTLEDGIVAVHRAAD